MEVVELNQAISEYLQKWQKMQTELKDPEYFGKLKPTAIGWKTTDLTEFDRMFAALREQCDQIHLGWVNERWLASMHLKDQKLEGGIEVIKLMQRRPGSEDAVGLDHLDFLVPDLETAETKLKAEINLKWTKETNNPHCQWLSIWFKDTEAKLRDNTVLDVCIAELQEVNNRLV